MTSPTRRFVGSMALLVFLLVYLFFALAVGDVVIATKSGLVQLAYFAIAGIAWVAPAGLLVKWMYAPVGPKA